MNADCDSICTLKNALSAGKITPAEVEQRLSAAIEAEYAKPQPRMAFIHACEDLLREICTEGALPFASRVEEDEAFIQSRAKVRRNSYSWPVWVKACAAAMVFVLLAAFGQKFGKFAWMTGQTIDDGEMYLLRGHEVKLEMIQGAIADDEPQQTPDVPGASAYRPGFCKTGDYQEAAAFLGCSPALPDLTVIGAAAEQFEIYLEPDVTLFTVLFRKADGMTVVYRIEQYADPEEAYLMIQQNGEGWTERLAGTDVYFSMNYEKAGFTWWDGLTVYHLGGSIDQDTGREVVRALIEEMH